MNRTPLSPLDAAGAGRRDSGAGKTPARGGNGIGEPASAPAEAQAPASAAKGSMQVTDLYAYYGKFAALKGVSLTIEPRAVTAFIGPSGCGKTTILRCFNRLHEVIRDAHITGRVLLDGQDIYARGVDPVTVRSRIGMVFQKPNPFPTMSIYDNVVAGLRLKGVRGRSRLDEACETALRQAALWDEVKDKLHKGGTSLSGGQQQRLCIARALAVRPDVLLMDEPASSLDPISTFKIEELIAQLKKEVTIVIVTHNMQQAARVSDQTAFFWLGDLIEMDRTEKIFHSPSRRETEDYVTGRVG